MSNTNVTNIRHEDSVAYEAMNSIGLGDNTHTLFDELDICFKYDIVPMLEGQPGVAKSSVVYQYAALHNINIVEFRPALEDLSGIKGLPNFVDENGQTIVEWAIPAHFPRQAEWEGILFIDEVVKASPSMQGALSQLVLDRKVGSYELPKGVRIVLAGNRTKDRAAAFKMPSDLANRVSRIPVEFQLAPWSGWAKEVGLPDVAIAFANYRSELLSGFDPALDINCTARTFAMAAPLVDEESSAALKVAQGLIGEGPAAEYFGFYQYWNTVPSLEAVKKRGNELPVPEDPAVQYATIAKLGESLNEDNMEAIWTYLSRFSRENQAVFWRTAMSRDRSIGATALFGEWLIDNVDYLK